MRLPSLLAVCLLGCIPFVPPASAEEKPKPRPVVSATETNLPYYEGEALAKADAYQKETCKLDIAYPTDVPGFATLIWFHGGGLTEGARYFPDIKDRGIAVVAVSYRLSPQAPLPSFLDDAAASTAWVLRHIEKYGGDPRKVFVSGHSAGGYLAAMIGMDPRWLAKNGISNRQLAGILPVSAQVTTHFHVKKLRGDTGESLRPVIDEYAPLYYAAKDLPPICLITGDRRVEFKSRVEENDLLAATLRNLGHPRVEFYEMGGLDHGSVVRGAAILLPKLIERLSKQTAAAPAGT
ncbi:MAG: alpha/beta hydrolase [Chthoniobacteraceae bacterium]|nr:alpha/beta hydrolase [Chthoniobacteraceae bacterium]